LIHSVPFDENGEMIVEEFEKLGNPASHGCIRLRLEEAKWLYETLPLGVKVVIY
jgi:lipoprotein-anchoring transpeptidase ErfK/SrfK